jgi:hypothetical protein
MNQCPFSSYTHTHMSVCVCVYIRREKKRKVGRVKDRLTCEKMKLKAKKIEQEKLLKIE